MSSFCAAEGETSHLCELFCYNIEILFFKVNSERKSNSETGTISVLSWISDSFQRMNQISCDKPKIKHGFKLSLQTSPELVILLNIWCWTRIIVANYSAS